MNTTTHVHTSKCTSPRHHGHHGSHAACYEAGLHDKSKVARERCRVGSYKRTDPVQMPTFIKSKISSVTHAATIGELGPEPVCDTKIPIESVTVGYDESFSVTCKKCLKKSA